MSHLTDSPLGEAPKGWLDGRPALGNVEASDTGSALTDLTIAPGRSGPWMGRNKCLLTTYYLPSIVLSLLFLLFSLVPIIRA